MTRNKIKDYISQGQRFAFCFEFVFSCGEVLYLTSSDKKINQNNKLYQTYSGLKIECCNFNDSAQDEVIITGIFENSGIDKNHKLDSARVKVLFYFFEISEMFEWINYQFDRILSDGMKFRIILRSDTVKFQKSVLKNFSTTCRAIFGDDKCKVEKFAYAAIYSAIRIEGKVITLENCNKADGAFVGGQLVFNNGKIYDIKAHNKKLITLEKYCDEKAPQRVTLTPGCNKKFITCCNIYNNAINFRGEPAIPWKVP
ncbi:MAG: hypothetical protein RLZZ59_732 [Pseudomonadota bacterium]|jgi:uncharacterized phage protein (TIGR02218 family)